MITTRISKSLLNQLDHFSINSELHNSAKSASAQTQASDFNERELPQTLSTLAVDVNSELLNITRKLSNDPAKKYVPKEDKSGNLCSETPKYNPEIAET